MFQGQTEAMGLLIKGIKSRVNSGVKNGVNSGVIFLSSDPNVGPERSRTTNWTCTDTTGNFPEILAKAWKL